MWEQKDYTFQGEHFAVRQAAQRPPQAVWQRATRRSGSRCGNPPTFGKAGELGIGALGFNFSPIHEMRPLIEAYKAGIAECRSPIGQFVNDNVMITNAVRLLRGPRQGPRVATRDGRGYLYSLVCLYHDTFPKPEGPHVAGAAAGELARRPRRGHRARVRCSAATPDEVCEQLQALRGGRRRPGRCSACPAT